MESPIVSRLLIEEPDMARIVVGFLNGTLANNTQGIHLCSEKEDWQKMVELVHDLKGSGANYGYPELVSVMISIEKLLLERSHAELPQLLQNLDKIKQRIYLGAPKNID